MEKAYFGNIESVILQQISAAQYEITIAVAWFTNQNLFDELIRALKRGASLKILIHDDLQNRSEFGLDFGVLTKLGAEIRFANTDLGTMHNKFCIIDNTVITGSYNWTYHANKNSENILLTDEESVVKSYREEFNRLFGDATAVLQPYEHLEWIDVKEEDFSEFRRNIFRDIVANNDENRELKRIKLINLDHAYKSGNIEKLAKASSLPTEEKLRTITDVLTSCAHDFELKLWEENITGRPQDDIDGYYRLCKWIFLPYDIVEGTNHSEYIKGEFKTYSSRDDNWVGGCSIEIYDKQFIEIIKRYDNQKRGDDWFKDIPEKILRIELAQMFFYKFPFPMYHAGHPITWPNTTPRQISAINVFGIAKEVDGDNIFFYEGWDPNERGQKIQNKYFSR